jgi:hypothetical protein
LKVDGSRLALVLAGRQSKGSTLVVNLLLDKEGNAVDGGAVDISRQVGASGCSRGGRCGDSNSRDNGGSARESCALDDSNDGNELRYGVCDCGCGHGNNGSLSTRALGNVGRSRNDSDRAADGQSFASNSNEAGRVDDLSVDDGGNGTSNSAAGVSAGVASSIASRATAADSTTSVSASVARVGTGSKGSRKGDNRTRSDHCGSRDTRAVGENSRSCNGGWDSTDGNSLATVDGHRRRVNIFSDLGDSRQSSDIAGWVGWRRGSHCVSSNVKVDSLGSWTSWSDKLGDGSRRTCVASLGTRSCSNHSAQAEEAGEMDPRVHVGERGTKVWMSESDGTIDLEVLLS